MVYIVTYDRSFLSFFRQEANIFALFRLHTSINIYFKKHNNNDDDDDDIIITRETFQEAKWVIYWFAQTQSEMFRTVGEKNKNNKKKTQDIFFF